MGSSNETGSFWGVLARKAKAILEDDNINTQQQQQADHLLTPKRLDSPKANHHHHPQLLLSKKLDTPSPPATLTCSMRDSIGKTLEVRAHFNPMYILVYLSIIDLCCMN